MEVKLGQKVKDIVTGFEGTAHQFMERLGGNTLVGVQPVAAGLTINEIPDAVFFDEFTLRILNAKINKKIPPADDSVTIKLGELVEDRASGFKGIAVSKTTHLNGCVYFGIQPPVTKNVFEEQIIFDHKRLRRVGPGVTKKMKTEDDENSGGPIVKSSSLRRA